MLKEIPDREKLLTVAQGGFRHGDAFQLPPTTLSFRVKRQQRAIAARRIRVTPHY